jgi:delta14-sterol reductase
VLLGTLTRGMVLIVAVQTLYIAHYFVHEVLVLNMIDFLADNMGWMLGWGNLVWVSMVYSLPAMHALHNPQEMNLITAGILLGIAILGYVIFAQVLCEISLKTHPIFFKSNIQKFQFRDDPKKPIWGKPPKVVPTKSGKGLLASGWWGVIRKPNYTGDLIIAYSYGLPSFTIGVAPYIIAIFLTVLLLNRAKRDDGWCKAKYGDDWDKYCKVVPYMLIPYIF